MTIKEQLYNKCQQVLNSRLNVIQNSISDIQNALLSESKSSAGDKHETGRAMLQLEREKAGKQLAELQKQMKVLNRIDTDLLSEKVALGSVVKTTKSNYFIAISAGEIKANEEQFYAVSASTPIGKLLLSKIKGDEVKFMQQQFTILSVL